MAAIERDSPFVFVTWLAKLMAGSTSCEWSPWFRTHHQNWTKLASDFNQAKYQMEHSSALRGLRSEVMPDESATVEGQNQFWYRRSSGLVLKGQPDLVVRRGSIARVFDAKTGKPKDADVLQVMIYMYCLPQVEASLDGFLMNGTVVYSDHRVDIPFHALDESFERSFNECLDLLESNVAPIRSPSMSECRFCDIASQDCPERVEALVSI